MRVGKLRVIYYAVATFPLGGLGVDALAQNDKPDFLKNYETKGVPSQSRVTKFDGVSSLPLPQQTKQTPNTLVVEEQPITKEEKEAFDAAANALNKSDELSIKLGKDSQLLSGGELPKGKAVAGKTSPQYKFTYYNYKNDQAIEAFVSNGKVVKIREREIGYQPTISSSELQEAAEIAGEKLDKIKKINPESLRGLAQSGPDGRRQIFLFGDQPNKPTAVVDLHDKRVVETK